MPNLTSKIKSTLSASGFKRYFFNTSWMLAEQVLRLLSGLFVGIYVARYLGPEQFGIYSYALAFVSLFGAIAKLGLDNIVVRELVRTPNDRDQILGTAFWLKVIGGLLVIGSLSAVLPWTSNDDTTNIYILIIAGGLLFQSFDIVDFYYQSIVKVKYVSIGKTIQLIISASVRIYLVIVDADLLLFVIATLFDQVVLSLAYVYFINHHKLSSALYGLNFHKAKSLLGDSWPLMLSGLAVMLYMRIDQVMIKEFIGPTEVGLYSVAVKLSEAWNILPVVVATSLYPSIIMLKSGDPVRYLDRLYKIMSILSFLSLAYSAFIFWFGKYLVVLLFGDDYIYAYDVLVVHAWSSIFVGLGVVSGKWLVAEKMEHYALKRVFLGAVVNVVLNFPLIFYFGIVGAAWATLLAQIFAAYLYDAFPIKTRDMFIIKTRVLTLNLVR